MKAYFLMYAFCPLYSFFRALKIDMTPRKGASLLNFLVFKQALFNIMLNLIHSPYTIHTWAIHHLYLGYTPSIPGLWSIYGKNMNYQGGQEGRFSEKSEKCADFGKYGSGGASQNLRHYPI